MMLIVNIIKSTLVSEVKVRTFTTSGPVIKRYEVSLTIKVQSVNAGEYTAPPAHGPAINK